MKKATMVHVVSMPAVNLCLICIIAVSLRSDLDEAELLPFDIK